MLAASAQRAVICRDMERWAQIVFSNEESMSHWRSAPFLRLMTFHPEFRNLFYYRIEWPGRWFSPLCRPLQTLYITTPDIGLGRYIQHGFATIISACRIGRDCWINQR